MMGIAACTQRRETDPFGSQKLIHPDRGSGPSGAGRPLKGMRRMD
jgi:hypothetical protein